MIGNVALLPVKTNHRGPAPMWSGEGLDIIDEALQYFKANVLFKNYEIKSPSDRTLIYITLYITECLKKLQRCGSKNEGMKEMHTLALKEFPCPGDRGFCLNAYYSAPANRNEADTMRAYFLQLRQETGLRVCERVFDNDAGKPSKWWICFVRRKFMDVSLSAPGQ
ncbi:unnamed protein product [Dimorphilus gyrociliatus]|uniref:Actin-related protein 2/3 complex subunit 3 n=1 Tax=Dimorphilus gyrociliatus TaxID=2664684 RepID=A0A7I8W7J8_9ANNE|nr:unnamed protein product [Dimorphilus gyrociliatus]